MPDRIVVGDPVSEYRGAINELHAAVVAHVLVSRSINVPTTDFALGENTTRLAWTQPPGLETPDGWWEGVAPWRVFVPETGLYVGSVSGVWENNDIDGLRHVIFNTPDNQNRREWLGPAVGALNSVTGTPFNIPLHVMRLDAGDEVHVDARQNSGSGVVVGGMLSLYRLGAYVAP